MVASARRVAGSDPRPSRCSVLLAGLLAGCAPGTGPDAQNDARRALAATEEPVLMALVGNPFEMDQARLSALVSSELARGVTGMRTAFTSSAERAAAPEPHLVVVLNPVNEPLPAALCRTSETVRTGPAAEQVHILAAFCRGDQVLNVAREEAVVGGPTDQSFRRLVWRTASTLFPDDYAETYGFGFLPRWLDFGVGGSFP
jgi:hypothetical protein